MRPYTAEEVKNVIFAMDGNNAPGPDGFGSFYFKDTWHIVGEDIIAVVLDFFQHGKMLKSLNTTLITLIPKTSCPKNVKDTQGAFVHSRNIIHNIMIVQDLVRHYNRKSAKPSCIMKLDMQKAYDTVNWSFLKEMLLALDFPTRCTATKLTHLSFADDLILCSKGDFASVYLMLRAFRLFSDSSGLKINTKKSSFYCCGIQEGEVMRIQNVSGISREKLPFKYLGVPIYSKRISAAQCENLVDKMTAKIRIWSTRHISYSGRVQLVNSVLMSIHGYWGQIFILPSSVIKKIEAVCRAFLWAGTYYSAKGGYVAWQELCNSKSKGGLGFRHINNWNKACLGKHVWAVATKKDTVWVRWVHSVYIKDTDWWEYNPPTGSSWYWKHICEVKNLMKRYYSRQEV
ncbi:uncharacterized protein LOC130591805 [Beta vulgaris subsp. vulgaris]|uniref:uncharacterized protein LOC130591805 n=1 Tax=Beta vulgaris subsp. vulgaris TaxID=3555 RepID=UPI0025468565|nr:uncharacterized protein LOC130591805 [Beta vulgaris subsp. vulgaris]